MPALAVTKTRIGLVCPECGSIDKSGKSSCCGRGGSWFGNCGSAGGMKLDHTRHEGIWACKARQFQAEASQQLHASQAKSNASSDDFSVSMVSRAVVVPAHIFGSTSVYTPKPVPLVSSLTLPVNTDATNDTSTTASKSTGSTITTSTQTSLGMLLLRLIILLNAGTYGLSMSSELTEIYQTPSSTSSARWSVAIHIIIQIIMILFSFYR